MYRELASVDDFGTNGIGPYAGQPGSIRLDDLPLDVRQRLARSLDGAEEPRPILRSDRALPGAGFMLALVLMIALGLELALAGMDFGRFAHHADVIVGYVTLTIIAAFAADELWVRRRRTVVSRGTFLLPLDVLEIADGILRVLPMGGLRRAGIEDGTLVLSFANGERHAFRASNEAEAAYRQLVHAQRELVTLTYSPELARALKLDPFFTLRTETSGPTFRESVPRAPHRLVRLLTVAVAGCVVAIGLWALRNAASAHVVSRIAAEVAQKRKLQTPPPAIPATESLHEKRRWTPSAQLDPTEANARREAHRQVLQTFGHHAASPAALAFVEQALRAADERGRPCVDVIANGGDELVPYEQRVIRTLRMALSQHVPTDLLEVCEPSGPARPIDAALPHIAITITRVGDSGFMFNVLLHMAAADAGTGRTGFRLELPAPDKPLTAVRHQSLFHVDAQAADAPVRFATARAFDRLYDELYSLLMTGNPLVVVPNEELPQ
jgi:hypothetical protein